MLQKKRVGRAPLIIIRMRSGSKRWSRKGRSAIRLKTEGLITLAPFSWKRVYRKQLWGSTLTWREEIGWSVSVLPQAATTIQQIRTLPNWLPHLAALNPALRCDIRPRKAVAADPAKALEVSIAVGLYGIGRVHMQTSSVHWFSVPQTGP